MEKIYYGGAEALIIAEGFCRNGARTTLEQALKYHLSEFCPQRAATLLPSRYISQQLSFITHRSRLYRLGTTTFTVDNLVLIKEN